MVILDKLIQELLLDDSKDFHTVDPFHMKLIDVYIHLLVLILVTLFWLQVSPPQNATFAVEKDCTDSP